MVKKSEKASETAPRRDGERFRVLLVATLATATEEQPVKIRDISTWGAMVEGGRLFSKGTELTLKRGEQELFANVAWNNGRRCGIRFDDPLSPGELQGFIKQSGRVHAEPLDASFRSGCAPEPMTPAQWAAIKAWRAADDQSGIEG